MKYRRRRLYEAIPTFILIGIFIYSFYVRYIMHGIWVNLFAYSLVGLFLYSSVIIYVEGAFVSRDWLNSGSKEKEPWKFFGIYMALVMFLPILFGIFLMNHN